MYLHGRFGDAHLAGNLLVQLILRDLNQNRALSRSEHLESRSQLAQGFVGLAASAVASKSKIARRQPT